MSLEDIFAPFVDAIEPDVCVFVGPQNIDDEAAPPRIAWKPVGARITDAKQIANSTGDGPLGSRQWAIQVDVWGTDQGNAEALADLFLATAYRFLSKHSFKPQHSQETWNVGGVTGVGVTCTMVIYIERPILRTPAAIAKATAAIVKTGLGGDTVTETITDTET